ncbi:alpha/beta hydrolase [Nocardia sp. CDC159]|uniref:Alpha/beta hydrolase n=1 Tax=Nocardia pulmonis TaxID=2951408 RepID=A0A9X2E3A3_9NOCA|nr:MULTISPECIES: alpha/beta hydrolase [Nocardia]MCM6773457.1 alpha/beta hydrolase [Nocardia pulmonis]MCM6786344.1 alpha/beta hydrolase [Nocardia sp. CDC159]
MSLLRSGRVAALVVLTCVAAACTTSGREQPAPSAPAAPTPVALDRFYNQTPDWQSCNGFSEDRSVRFPRDAECTRLTVPVDYAKPDGATAEIAVSRIRATGPKIGSLLFNPGGPGVAGLSMASIAMKTPLAERFDLIGFDVRGVGSSRPLIRCLTGKEWDEQRAEPPKDNTPAGIAAAEQEDREFAQKCGERTGTEFLAHVGTREVIQDMDVIRGVLGDPKLNFVGYSYGTRLGSAYAEKFPDRVRALVLDGAVDPEQQPVQDTIEQTAGFQKAFDAYAAACTRDAECPLGTDPAQSVARFRALLAPLWNHPLPTKDGRPLSYGDAVTGVQNALYAEDRWETLSAGLAEVAQGRGDTLLALADDYNSRRPDGSYDNSQDAFLAIHCVDDPAIKDRAVTDQQDTELRKVAPFLDDGHGTGHAPLELCAFWPVPNTGGPHQVSAPGLPKTVVVSTTQDPATPYEAGVNLAKDLGAALITNRGTRHTAFLSGGVPCVDNAVFEYLIELKEPPAGLTCG